MLQCNISCHVQCHVRYATDASVWFHRMGQTSYIAKRLDSSTRAVPECCSYLTMKYSVYCVLGLGGSLNSHPELRLLVRNSD